MAERKRSLHQSGGSKSVCRDALVRRFIFQGRHTIILFAPIILAFFSSKVLLKVVIIDLSLKHELAQF